ncbi:MAG: serine/threonine-protein kinase [Fuerstiella sp.]
MDDSIQDAVAVTRLTPVPFGKAALPRTVHRPPVPVRLGRYRVEKTLGEGGFATVYLCEDEELQRKVAVKVPRRDKFRSEADYIEFFEEARVLARFDHPGIVPVFDVGREGDTQYIVTRYVDGDTLGRVARYQKLSYADSARIIRDCAEAIHAAHKQGIYHRDLKPGNILLNTSGQAFVADFGLAISHDALGVHSPVIEGTPRYMSPEQVQGNVQQIDGRSDIWSLGVVLYRLLTNRDAFTSDGDTLRSQIQNRDPIPLRQLDERIPKELEEICVRCLKKQPAERYQTAHDLAAALTGWLKATPATGTFRVTPATDPSLEDTSRGRNTVTHGWSNSVVVQRLKQHPVGSTLAAAAFLAGALFFLASLQGITGPAKKTDGTGQNQQAAEDRIKADDVPDPFHLDSYAIEGVWYPLLERRPTPLVWPDDGNTRIRFDGTLQEILLNSPHVCYLSLGKTSAPNYRISLRFSRTNWDHPTGLFIGLKKARWKEGEPLPQCLCIEIVRDSAMAEHRHQMNINHVVIAPGRSSTPEPVGFQLLNQPVIISGTFDEHLLELTVADDQLVSVTWNGEVIFQPLRDRLALPPTAQPVLLPSTDGEFGLFTVAGTTIFRDVRINLTKKD